MKLRPLENGARVSTPQPLSTRLARAIQVSVAGVFAYAAVPTEANAQAPTVEACLKAHGTEICQDQCMVNAVTERDQALAKCATDAACTAKAEQGYAADILRCEGKNAACSDGLDNDGDGKIDARDPGCWDNPKDPSTYNRDDNDEFNLAVCEDGVDNDRDGKIDAQDPTCHTDGNPDNPKSYRPKHPTEREPLKPLNPAQTGAVIQGLDTRAAQDLYNDYLRLCQEHPELAICQKPFDPITFCNENPDAAMCKKAEPVNVAVNNSTISQGLTEAEARAVVKQEVDPRGRVELEFGAFGAFAPNEKWKPENTTPVLGGGAMVRAGYSHRILSSNIRLGATGGIGVMVQRAKWNYVENNNTPNGHFIAEARAKAQFRTDKVVRPEIFVDANVVKGMGGGGGVGVEFAIPNKKKGPEFGVRVGAGVVNMDLGSGGQRQGTDNTELKDNERMRVNEVRLEVGFVLHIPRT